MPDQLPDALHELAFVELQVRVDDAPEVMLDGLTDNNTIGAAGSGRPDDPLVISSILAATICRVLA